MDADNAMDGARGSAAPKVLAVDLDGTLVRADLMQEAAMALACRNPLNLFRLLFWLARGIAHFKAMLAIHAPPPQPATLPYNEEFLAYLRRQRRPLVLATAAHQRHAEAVAAHLNLFDKVLATGGAGGDANLKGREKARRLCELYGENNFDYAGNSRDDIAVWARAEGKILVNAAAGLRRRYADSPCFDSPPSAARHTARQWLRALRLHHWAKNLLVFTAVFGGHQILSAPAMSAAALAFLIFGLLASAAYLLNDMVDVTHDRHHPIKRHRPIAAGGIGMLPAALMALVLLAAAALLCAALPPPFAVAAGVYFAVSLAYSLRLKQLLFVDILILAFLFTLRVIAGGEAAEITLSFWLLAFSIFIFTSLATLKRYAGLTIRGQENRAYRSEDALVLAVFGVAMGVGAILILALYIDSDIIRQRYATPQWLWLAIPLLINWLGRMWLLAGRGAVADDPLLFALRDRASQCSGVLLLLFVYWAS